MLETLAFQRTTLLLWRNSKRIYTFCQITTPIFTFGNRTSPLPYIFPHLVVSLLQLYLPNCEWAQLILGNKRYSWDFHIPQHSYPRAKGSSTSQLKQKAFQYRRSQCLGSKMLNLNSLDGNSNRNPLRDPVSLNIGGEIYTTTLDTLTHYRDSMLGAMFTGQIPVLRDKSGHVFIDRDGKIFRYILNYLRSNSLDLPDGFSEVALLRREADFFQIRPLLEEIRQYELSLPLSLRGGPLGAMIMVNVDSKVRYFVFKYIVSHYVSKELFYFKKTLWVIACFLTWPNYCIVLFCHSFLLSIRVVPLRTSTITS